MSEYTPFILKHSDTLVINTKDIVSVYFSYKRISPSSVCDASHMGENEWFINRMNTIPHHRRRGISDAILQKTISEIKKNNPSCIIVTPGGYGTLPEIQFRFYKRNGFIEHSTVEGLYYYKELNAPVHFLK